MPQLPTKSRASCLFRHYRVTFALHVGGIETGIYLMRSERRCAPLKKPRLIFVQNEMRNVGKDIVFNL